MVMMPKSRRFSGGLAVLTFSIMTVLGFVGMGAYAVQFPSGGVVASVAAVSLVTAGAAALTGALFGFVFAIPRSRRRESYGPEPRSRPQGEEGSSYRVNTNLEDISDWLTKIMIGIGIAEFRQIASQILALVSFLEPGLGGRPSSGGYGLSLLTYFATWGFLVGYLSTRIYITPRFVEAEQSLTETVERLQHQVEELRVRGTPDQPPQR
jgi:hypothetical protein